MKKILILSVFILFVTKTFGQTSNVITNEIYDLDKVKEGNVITYYGLDFTLLKFVKIRDAANDDKLRKYLGAWLSYFKKNESGEKLILSKLQFVRVIMDDYSVERNLDSVPQNWVVSSIQEVTIKDVEALIKAYNLKQNSGIGFVIHPVEFNDNEQIAKCFFTFFDNDTRKILWISETQGRTSGMGVTEWFGNGMLNCTKIYFNKILSKTLKG
jgi:hypothetical protein